MKQTALTSQTYWFIAHFCFRYKCRVLLSIFGAAYMAHTYADIHILWNMCIFLDSPNTISIFRVMGEPTKRKFIAPDINFSPLSHDCRCSEAPLSRANDALNNAVHFKFCIYAYMLSWHISIGASKHFDLFLLILMLITPQLQTKEQQHEPQKKERKNNWRRKVKIIDINLLCRKSFAQYSICMFYWEC